MFSRSACTFFSAKKNRDPCPSHLKPALGDVSGSEMHCVKTLAPQIGNPKCATSVPIDIFGGESSVTWWILLGLEPWCMVKFVVNSWWIFQRGKSKQTTFCRFFAANFAAYANYILTQKLRRKLRRQNFASKTSPTKSRQLSAFDKKICCSCGYLHKHACSAV